MVRRAGMPAAWGILGALLWKEAAVNFKVLGSRLTDRHVAVEALNSLAEAVRVLGPHLAPAQQEQVGGHLLGGVQRLAPRRGVRQVQLRLFGQDRGVQRRVHLEKKKEKV